MDLCVYDSTGMHELGRAPLPTRTGDVWHGHLPGAQAGMVYGLRAHGPWAPQQGHRFNPHKLLLDPYAREVLGHFEWRAEHFGHDRHHPSHLNTQDNGTHALKARVVADAFDWQGDELLHTPLTDTVLYECHVRGLTQLHPRVPEAERGTYAGVTSDAALAHFKRLGITAVSLMPVHHFLDEQRLAQMGLRNHWGYNTLGFFALAPRYGGGAQGQALRDQFKRMVRRLHAEGIEVILDVVYNHTAESDAHGPQLSLRGLDNASYYRTSADDLGHYINHTGCGNTVNLHHPRVLQWVLDSLRYWVQEMHVDGFRFDLAPVLGRGADGFERDGAFFKAVAQDPVLSRVKLIAEPWDIGPDGYRLGQFPGTWLEWNDKARDTLRSFWLGAPCSRGELAQRLCASADVFNPQRRAPNASVNYVVSHDGFTLADVVSYNHKHNQANGEENRDGHGHNLSWNCGVEGPTTDPSILALRGRLQRALLACNLFAQGTPMLAAGAELGHSQGGNNNAYCQDNEVSWLDWSKADETLLNFTAKVLQVRRERLPLGPAWYTGRPGESGHPDLRWLRSHGDAMRTEDWHSPDARVLGLQIWEPGRGTQPLLWLLNAQAEGVEFHLPSGTWSVLLDSADEPAADGSPWTLSFPLQARSVALLAQVALE